MYFFALKANIWLYTQNSMTFFVQLGAEKNINVNSLQNLHEIYLLLSESVV